MGRPRLSFYRRPYARNRLSLCVAIIIVLSVGLVNASSSLASYEQVGYFAGTGGALEPGYGSGSEAEQAARWPEEVQLGGVGGMAVNYTGAGGVPAGTVYAAGASFEGERVARFNPDGSFSEAWSFEGSPPHERCGPEGLLAQPTCDKRPSGVERSVDVDVDQSTGDVYVLSEVPFDGGTHTESEEEAYYAERMLVHVYSADGSKLIAEFGVEAPHAKTVAQSPEKIHRTVLEGSLAVNSAGQVYIYDQNENESEERLMEFVPAAPGDYEHYVYAGRTHDLTWDSNRLTRPVMDAAGFVYVSSGEKVAELDPADPGAAPMCEYSLPSGGITAMTVDPLTGEVFFYDYHDHRVHQLGACGAEGKFVEVSKTEPLSPNRTNVGGLAFDPVRSFATGRPPGVLYLGTPSGQGGNTEGQFGTSEYKLESSLGYVFARPVEAPPAVVSESVVHVASGSAVLGATVNPEGALTHYAFEYVTQAEFEADAMEPFADAVEVPLDGGVVGEGKGPVPVSEGLSGLAAETSYRYRVVAWSDCSVEEPEKVCETDSEAEGFRTFGMVSGVLPDGRVYELVSPPQKYGGQVYPANPDIGSCGLCKPAVTGNNGDYPRQASLDGDAVAYEGAPFNESSGPVFSNEYVARRNPQTGWQTTDVSPTLLKGKGYDVFSDDLSRTVFEEQEAAPLSDQAPGEYRDLYQQSTEEPSLLTSILSGEPPDRTVDGTGAFEVRYAGASSDLSRVFFEANDALTEEVAGVAPAAVDSGPTKFNLYEWDEGRLALVNVLPGNTTSEPDATFASDDAHGVSDDGTRVFFSDSAGQVFVREDGSTTREIETEGKPDTAGFMVASSDGSKVLLADGHLHYLTGEERTVDLTGGNGGFVGLVGQGEDLTHVYFVDSKVLTGSEENEDCTVNAGKKTCEGATEGKDNVYSWSESGGVHFIATLTASDDLEGAPGNTQPSDWTAEPALRTAQASPNGRFLAFLSTERLTGYDNTGPCETNHAGGFVSVPCPEVFTYDSATGRLVCASCNRSGVRPLGYSVLRVIDRQAPLPRYLSDEGRLFFDSEDSLVPSDTNAGVEDVYEYEPDDVGTCVESSGCVSLISGGTGRFDSNFLASDPSGANVFFTTADRLSPRDGDELLDLYDARVEGLRETGVLETECNGETCQSATVPSVLTVPSTVVFQGAGNVPPPPSPAKKTTPKKRTSKKTTRKATGKKCTANKKYKPKPCAKKKSKQGRKGAAGKASAGNGHGKSKRGGVK
jgi:hypothetical protein